MDPSRGWGSYEASGRSAPGAPPTPAGSPAFFGRKPEERTPGRKRFFLPGPTFSGWGDPARVLSFFCLACGPVSYARNGPPPGWAGWEGWFLRREEFFPPPQPSPRGEGAPVRTLGRMRGRFGTQPFLVEKRATACRPDGIFLLLRWASRSPPHQSPSVTASPQGEASGLCSPTRKSAPNQGTQMGTVIAPPPGHCGTTAKTSERQQAGH